MDSLVDKGGERNVAHSPVGNIEMSHRLGHYCSPVHFLSTVILCNHSVMQKKTRSRNLWVSLHFASAAGITPRHVQLKPFFSHQLV